MKMHVLDQLDREILVEIDKEVYRNLLKTKTGLELASAVKEAYTVVDGDPRWSALENARAFFSYDDVVKGYTDPAELLGELDS